MSQGTNETKEAGLEALASLVNKGTRSAILVQEGAIEPLLQLAQEGASVKVQQTASQILMVLSQHQSSQIAQHAIKPLILLSSSESPKVREYVAGLLGNLAQGGHSREVIEAGGIKPLIQMLHDESTDIQHQAVSALGYLACHADNRVEIARQKAIKPLIHLLESPSHPVVEMVTFALLQLTFYNKPNQKYMFDAGALKPLVALLKSAGHITRGNAASILHTLSLIHKTTVLNAILKSEVKTENISHRDLHELIARQVQKKNHARSGDDLVSPPMSPKSSQHPKQKPIKTTSFFRKIKFVFSSTKETKSNHSPPHSLRTRTSSSPAIPDPYTQGITTDPSPVTSPFSSPLSSPIVSPLTSPIISPATSPPIASPTISSPITSPRASHIDDEKASSEMSRSLPDLPPQPTILNCDSRSLEVAYDGSDEEWELDLNHTSAIVCFAFLYMAIFIN